MYGRDTVHSWVEIRAVKFDLSFPDFGSVQVCIFLTINIVIIIIQRMRKYDTLL